MWPFNRKVDTSATDSRAIDKMALWGKGEDPYEEVHAGVLVSQESALRVITAYRCIRLISESIATMPVDVLRNVGEDKQPVATGPFWLNVPNPENTWFEFIERVGESMAMDGNAFVLIGGRDRDGFPRELWTLNPHFVSLRRERGRIVPHWTPDPNFPEQTVRLEMFGPFNLMGDILHIRLNSAGGLRGLSPIDLAKQALGLAIVTEKFGARFFSRGTQLSGVIELPSTEPARSRQHIDIMRETWLATHQGSDRAHTPGILTGGATWKQLSISPEDAQFLDTRKFQVEEIARLYGVPPHMVGAMEKNTAWGTGIAELAHGFSKFTLMPWLVRLEQAFSQLLPRGQFIKFNQRSLLRGTPDEEADALSKAVQIGWLSRNEARALQDHMRRPGLDRYMAPLNEVILDEDGNPPEPEPPAPLENDEEETPDGTDTNTDEAA